ncbi:MAG: NAD(P)-dependent oxidoreductase [Lachnospiraceae bacterium]|nr:NAD(P)-dependent oxidoreductase [Lachnospiraceae bacterium]
MELYDSGLWMEDIGAAAKNVPEFGKLAGKTVFISGAAGLIASACVDMLIFYNLSHSEKINICAAGRSEEKLKKRFGVYAGREWFHIFQYDALKEISAFPSSCDYVIHAAGNAYPEKIMKEPVETMLANFNGIGRLMERAETAGMRRLLFVSSSEIYGRKDGTEPYREDEYGYIDHLNPRNSYSLAKKAAETLCAAYASEYGVSFVIARPGHIYGPTASESDNRVSSAFAFRAAGGENLVLKSSGSQLRSYCYAPDAASAILTLLLCGENGRAYNVGNPKSVLSIRQMAEIMARSAGVSLLWEEAGDAEKRGFNPMPNSSLDCALLVKLGWKEAFDAETGLDHTIRIIKSGQAAAAAALQDPIRRSGK